MTTGLGLIPILLFSGAGVAGRLELEVQPHRLSNGLQVLLHEDHSAPILTWQVFYRCGSRNERPGVTGISHLLEHMMFNGSAHYGPKEFDRLLEAAGGTSNGYTWKDYTSFMETFPPDALDLVLDLEADRMRGLAITAANLEQERGIVSEERRYAVENDNDGALTEALEGLLFLADPYRTPEVGWMADIQAIRQADVQAWYDRCYAPANALVVVAGDFRASAVVEGLERRFGGLAPGEQVSPPPYVDVDPSGLRYAELVRPAGQARFLVGWWGPGASASDTPALELLQHLLADGRASLLVDRLVYQDGVLVDLTASFVSLQGASVFVIDATLAEGTTPLEAEEALGRVLGEVRNRAPEAERLDRARRQAEMELYGALSTVEGKADLLGSTQILEGDWQSVARRPDAWAQVTPEQVRVAASRWLAPERRTVVALYPEDPAGDASGSEGGNEGGAE